MTAIDHLPLSLRVDDDYRLLPMQDPAAEVRADGLEQVKGVLGELLTTRDEPDFEDAMNDIVGRVDEWVNIPFTHRSFERFEVEKVLGKHEARRFFAALTMLEGRTGAASPERTKYAWALYARELEPERAILLCDLTAGYASTVAIVVALADGKTLPSWLARKLVLGTQLMVLAESALTRRWS